MPEDKIQTEVLHTRSAPARPTADKQSRASTGLALRATNRDGIPHHGQRAFRIAETALLLRAPTRRLPAEGIRRGGALSSVVRMIACPFVPEFSSCTGEISGKARFPSLSI